MACNPALGALLGWAPEDLVGRPILDIYAPAEHAGLRARIAEVDRLGKVRYEADMLRRDGGTVPVQLDLVAVRGEDGAPLYRVATIQDIRERRTAMTALEHARDDLRAFARKLDEDIEGERKRLAREVHDQLGQIFTALKLNVLGWAPGAAMDHARLEQFGVLLDEGIRVARRISADLRPTMLDDLGLGPALAHFGQALGAQAGFAVEVDIQRDARLGAECVNQLFRVAQEGLTNVARHAGASRARVHGVVVDGHYRLTVEDDGHGSGNTKDGGLGLLGMRERAALIGARLDVGASELGGLRVTLSLPLIKGEGDEANSAGG
jgi:PAS domain S-box-containing protein